MSENKVVKGNGRQRGGVRRDAQGFTEKMRQCIPVVAAARTKHQGVQECVELGLVSSTNYYYRAWVTRKEFRDAVNEEHERLNGDMKESAESTLRYFVQDMIMDLVQTALSKRADKMRAQEVAYTMLGFDTGRSARFTNVQQTNIQTVAEKQQGFKDRFAELFETRTPGTRVSDE